MSVRCLIERPGLLAALAGRGLDPANDAPRLILAEAASTATLARLQRDHPDATLLVVAPDDASEITLIDAGFETIAPGSGASVIAARAAALRRRAAPMMKVGDLVIDRVAHSARRAGRALHLLPREYRLLLHLAHRAGHIVGREELRRAVWGLAFDPGTNVIEVQVSRLRAKLDRGFAEAMIVTEKGQGYRLVATPTRVATLAATR